MKKLISLLLALVMVLSLSTVAFADATVGDETYKDVTSVNIPVTYTLVGNGTSPAETFTVTQTASRVADGDATSAPALASIVGAEFSEGAAIADGTTQNIVVTLPTYEKVGVYEYTLTPAVGATAGVTYRPATETIKLVVTVINDDVTGYVRVAGVHTETSGNNKTGGIGYTYSAGTLNVSKTVTGKLGDKTKEFTFNVALTGVNGKTYADSFTAKVNAGLDDERSVNISMRDQNPFTLKHGDTLTIENLPYGVEYTVTENDYSGEGYTTNATGDEGTISAGTQSATFTNDKVGDIDTGVMLDSLPYMLILAVVAVTGTALIFKKRTNI